MKYNLARLALFSSLFFTQPTTVSWQRNEKNEEYCLTGAYPSQKSSIPTKKELEFIRAMKNLNLDCKNITSSKTEIKPKIIYLDRLSKEEELAGLRLIKQNIAPLILEDIMKNEGYAYKITGYNAIKRFFEHLESEATKIYSNSRQDVIYKAKLEASFLRKVKKIFLNKTKLLQNNYSDIELTIRSRSQRHQSRIHVHSLNDDINGRPVIVKGEIILGLGDPVTEFFNGNFTKSSVQQITTHSTTVDSDDYEVIKIIPGEIVATHFCYPHKSPELQDDNRNGGLLLSLAILKKSDK